MKEESARQTIVVNRLIDMGWKVDVGADRGYGTVFLSRRPRRGVTIYAQVNQNADVLGDPAARKDSEGAL